MRILSYCMAGIIMLAAGGVYGAEAKIEPTPAHYASGDKVVPALKLTASKITTEGGSVTATLGQLRSGDGVLTATADTVNVKESKNREKSDEAPIITVGLDGNVKLTIKIKGQPDLGATASHGDIDWDRKIVALKGEVSITTGPAGKNQPAPIKCDSAVFRWAEKLPHGQIRVTVQNNSENS